MWISLIFNPLLLWNFTSLILISLLLVISLMFMSNEYSINTNTQFECGMESMHPNTVPMYMHFYLVAILFLIFDMEFVISLPLINILAWYFQYPYWWLFIVTLTLGLMIEIVYGSINWKE